MLAILMVYSPELNAQKKDKKVKNNKSDTTLVKPHSPSRATIYSAVLPGLGQGYNKKYWKIPIIYVGFGVFTYFIVTNNKEYKKFKDAYVYVANGDSTGTDNDYVNKYSEDQLKDGMDTYRKYRDLTLILTGLWYILNILDANVDAHLFDYDISDDLSLRWEPIIPQPVMMPARDQYYQPAGLRITFNF